MKRKTKNQPTLNPIQRTTIIDIRPGVQLRMVEIDIQKLYMPLPEAIKVNGRWYVRVTGKDFENFCRLEETSRNGKLILIEKIKADANKRLESEISCLKNVVSYAIDKYAHPDKYKDDLTDAEKQMFPSQRRLLKKKTSKI